MVDKPKKFFVSHRSLKFLAALFWYGGSLALGLKAGQLFIQAESLKPEQGWLWMSIAGGLIVGGLKGELLFKRSCRANLARIGALEDPRIWQFFRPRFFIFLTLMIALGATLSRLAQDNYPLLISVAFIDLSVGVALLWSSRYFWK